MVTASPPSPSPQNKAQNGDGYENPTVTKETSTVTNSERGDGWNGKGDGWIDSHHSTVTYTNTSNGNGLGAKGDGGDGVTTVTKPAK